MGGGGGNEAKTEVELESREWYMAAYAAEGVPTSDHLKLRTVKLSVAADSIPDGHVALELLFVSVDPYLRTRMSGSRDPVQFELNHVISAFGIGRVIRSKDSKYEEGDIVVHPNCPIAEYCVTSSLMLRKFDPNSGISLPDYISSMGVPGFAAWVGIEVLGDPKPGSNVFVSAASGAVGMYAGQLAKLRGCRVIGSTGSDDKIKLMKEEFGYDDGFNYHKETDYDAALSRYFPNGIDVYLDNVGGRMLEAVLNHVNKYARIPLCGMISQYNKVWTEREGVRNLLNMVGKEVRMEGFMLASYSHRFVEFAEVMEIESFLESLASLFTSSNVGKVVVQVKP
ncbi:2-alkenal reductase (NADP(+)-dependent)-like [Neltuma alba]|uniref:2-alkenal reductase (NADP(+)-dependent)-like n=1 Tax=Neltuma alba TaxID=207710 RepID=UPI0010A3CC24|nr:2-alkenal reductase (NADP(+)-dependent)-like [Prosopis alba]